jgi:hypothetical protein
VQILVYNFAIFRNNEYNLIRHRTHRTMNI